VTNPDDGARPPDRQPAKRWGLGDIVSAAVAGLLLASVTGGIWMSATGQTANAIGTDLASLVGEWVGVVSVLVFASRVKGEGQLSLDYGLAFDPRADLFPGVAAGVGSQIVLSALVTPLVQHFQRHIKLSEHAIDVGKQAASSATATKFAVVVVFVIGAPVVEELFFRGALQRALIRRLGPVPGIAITSVVFALLHLSGHVSLGSAITLVAELTAFGVVLSLLALRTGRLGAGIVAHAAFNAVATYSLLHL
jgi:membrane protease YdiL (CAAX protease family)